MPAAKTSVPIQSRWAIQVGTWSAWNVQYHGPIGNRYPMFWWVTLPLPTLGFHMYIAERRRRVGSR